MVSNYQSPHLFQFLVLDHTIYKYTLCLVYNILPTKSVKGRSLLHWIWVGYSCILLLAAAG